ncbi:PEP/pyruvate-binding domain-containing protein [Corynebacterium guangdongense]|uniref:Phosphoenolpyruvate synthase n=1 Tax=Corynebacterium guangdongense TaxID=1783348 RepID=A0ABU1ZYQ7_9CORY|nr:PEP/pyruvate-binding domain-containing protein [Corynebacterium guangdongense]MDR7330069.1 pyruvate,water dikinase [Corynebacterium guangdongense]WJZ18627.1 Phosphoenolpyruvate synthase [Corynebacterium guangdongense]
MTEHNPYIQTFDDPREPLLEDLGGKGASLVSMTAAGMPVPPGFVVTTKNYLDFIEGSGISAKIDEHLATIDPDDVAAIDVLAGKIRDALLNRPIAETQRIVLKEAYEDLMARCGGGDVPVAVRSSATAEDLPEASFAGQQDTYLWVTGYEDVREHIRMCWASLFTTRAITYRLKNNIPTDGLGMAVVVQKMVNARVAGVAMTLNPNNGDRSKIAVDSSWGVGEMVVSGEVTPDHILLDKITLQVVTEHLGDKHAELVPDAEAGTLVQREVEPERAQRRSLTDAELEAVARMAKRAEKHYKSPQDIEWALDADLPDGENLLLLQSRPETVHSNLTQEPEKATPASPAGGAFDLSSLTSAFLPS